MSMADHEAAAAASEPESSTEDSTPLLREPADGVPEPIVTADGLQQAAAALAAGSGPIAVDAERASGYRYSQRAYLVQLRRAGAGDQWRVHSHARTGARQADVAHGTFESRVS